MITQRNNGTWLVSIGSGENRFRKVVKTFNEAKAVEATEEARRAQERVGGFVRQEKKPQQGKKTMLELYNRTKQLMWANDSGAQADNALRVLKLLGENRSISSLDQKTINDLVSKMYAENNTGATVNRKLSALSVMLKVAELEGLISHTFRMPRQKEGKNRTRVLSVEEEQTMYKLCDLLGLAGLKDYIQFTIDTGFRRNESLKIREEDIQTIFRNGKKVAFAVLHDGETKSGKGRSVPLTKRAVEIVNARRGHGRIFYDLSEYQAVKGWNAVKSAMGLEDDKGFVIHALRHTCLTRLGESGKSAISIQKWAGHSSIMMSQKYVHVGADFLISGVDALEQSA